MKFYQKYARCLIIWSLAAGLLASALLYNKLVKLKAVNDYNEDLVTALTDSLTKSINKYNEVTYQKHVLQGNLSDLTKSYELLSDNQKELLNRLKQANKSNKVLTSALLQSQLKIDSLSTNHQVLVDSNSVRFFDSLPDISYDISVYNVRALNNPKLIFNSLKHFNKQSIMITEMKNKPPVITISNSNKYLEITELDAIVVNKKRHKFNRSHAFALGVITGGLAIFFIQ